MRDWITTGRAYMRAQLAADKTGLRFQPVSQVLQEYPQMDTLRARIETLTSTAPPAKLQILVRVGHTTRNPASPHGATSTHSSKRAPRPAQPPRPPPTRENNRTSRRNRRAAGGDSRVAPPTSANPRHQLAQ